MYQEDVSVLNMATGSQSWWARNGYGCHADAVFINNTMIQSSSSSLPTVTGPGGYVSTTVVGCIVSYEYVEVLHAGVQCVLVVSTCPVITHAGCIAAGIGRALSRVCLFVCLFFHALKGKRLEPSTPNLVHVYSIAVARHALTQRLKGRDHMVTKMATVARLLVTRVHAATVVAGVGLHVDTELPVVWYDLLH